jgi:hypothetical protein
MRIMSFNKVGVFIAAACTVVSIQAQVVNLNHNNTFAQVSLNTQAGMFNWTVDGQPQLFQQWFWYRVGSGGPEQSIDTIGAPVFSTPTARDLTATYFAPGFNISIDYHLTGGLLGSGVADVAETITINNTGPNPLPMHFFQYSDFDLGTTPGGDTVELFPILGKYFVARQTQLGISFSETVTTPGADHGEAAAVPLTLNKLNNPVPDTLADINGPFSGNVTWAFQWDLLIAPGDSKIISKDKRLEINLVPEPATGSLVILGLGALALRRRK